MFKKLTFISWLSIVLCSCTSKVNNPKVILSGSITNPNEKLLLIAGNDTFRDTIRIDESGNFKDTLNLLPGSYLLSYGKLFWRTYLQNGYDIQITFDSKNFNETIKYAGTGGNENNYVFHKLSKQRQTMENRIQAMKNINDSSLSLLNKQKVELLSYLNDYPSLDPAFRKLEQRNINHGYTLDIKRLEKIDTLNQVEGLNDELEKLNPAINYGNGMDYLFSSSYKRIVENFHRDNALQTAKASGLKYDIAFLKEISTIKNDTIRNSLAYNHAKYGITYTKDLNTFYSLFLKASTDASHNKEVSASYEVLKKVAKGSPSPNFEAYENYAGGNTSLKDLAGSYLYIDVWATWCGPCRKEIPYLKKLETKYHGKNIKFVSISIDKQKDREKWKQMIKEEQLGGVQLLADNDWESSFVKEYLIKGIPRFIILDPQGNIIDYNAPTPSSGELEAIFSEFDI